MTELNLDSNSSISQIREYEKKLTKGYWLNRYHAVWCGHCIQMSDEWKKFIKQKKKENVKFASVEESALSQLKNQPINFRGFPTITLTKNGKLISEFNGERTSKNFQKFINENCPDISSSPTPKKINKKKRTSKKKKEQKKK